MPRGAVELPLTDDGQCKSIVGSIRLSLSRQVTGSLARGTHERV